MQKVQARAEAAGAWPDGRRTVDFESASVTDVGAMIARALGIGAQAGDLAAATWVLPSGRRILPIAATGDHVLPAVGDALSGLLRGRQVCDLRICAARVVPL
jgi:hypothetical protein